MKRQWEQKKEWQAKGRMKEQLCWRSEKGGKEYRFSNLWQRGSKRWLLPKAFWRHESWLCYTTALGRARPKAHQPAAPGGSHAGRVGSIRFSGQTFVPRGRSLWSSSARLMGGSGLLELLLCRARSRCHSKTKPHSRYRRAWATLGAGSSSGAHCVLQSHPEKHSRSLVWRSPLSQLGCYQSELAAFD